MKVLILGGAGYVGSHTVYELAQAGHEIVIYDSLVTGHRELAAGFPLVVGDIGEKERLKRCLKGVQAVFHFAASAYVGESMTNPRKYFRNNVEAALQLMDAILESEVRLFIFSSSCAVYGIPASLPICETFPANPVNPYGDTKLFFEKVLSAYSYSDRVKYVALRYFNAAGAHLAGNLGEYHTDETHIIPLALKAILRTKPPLRIFGANHPTSDGTCVRDFVHVSDLGRAHVKALEYLRRGGDSIVLNLGSGEPTSIAQLLAAIRSVTGQEVPCQSVGSRPGDPPALYSDATLAKKILGWQPSLGLDDILSTAWTWENEGLPKIQLPPVAHMSALAY